MFNQANCASWACHCHRSQPVETAVCCHLQPEPCRTTPTRYRACDSREVTGSCSHPFGHLSSAPTLDPLRCLRLSSGPSCDDPLDPPLIRLAASLRSCSFGSPCGVPLALWRLTAKRSLRQLGRSPPASPWGLWSRRTARFVLLAGCESRLLESRRNARKRPRHSDG